jgi:hypothetical protein
MCVPPRLCPSENGKRVTFSLLAFGFGFSDDSPPSADSVRKSSPARLGCLFSCAAFLDNDASTTAEWKSLLYFM